MSGAFPPDFQIPAELRCGAELIRQRYTFTAKHLAAELYELGLPQGQAETVAVDWLVRQACEMAMAAAIQEGRTPKRERWQLATGRSFDHVSGLFMLDPRLFQ